MLAPHQAMQRIQERASEPAAAVQRSGPSPAASGEAQIQRASSFGHRLVSASPIQAKRRRKTVWGPKMSLGQFHAHVDALREHDQRAPTEPWRRWNSQTERGETVTGIPPSTHQIPATLSHVTHYSALPSIRRTGLDPAFKNSKTGLNARSHTDKYFKRDHHLSAVYMGTDAHVGGGMEDEDQTDEGGRVNLLVHAPPEFRRRYMRQASAVISNDRGNFDNGSAGNTALSFGRIPPEYLYLQHPVSGKTRPLTSLRGRRNHEFDFRPYATRPGADQEPLLSNQELIEKQRRQQALLAAARRQPVPELAEVPEHKQEAPQGVALSSTSMQSMLARFANAHNNNSDSHSDSEEWED